MTHKLRQQTGLKLDVLLKPLPQKHCSQKSCFIYGLSSVRNGEESTLYRALSERFLFRSSGDIWSAAAAGPDADTGAPGVRGRTGMLVSNSRRHRRPNGAELSQLQRRWCVPRCDANHYKCVTSFPLFHFPIGSIRMRRRYLLLQACHKSAKDLRHGECRALATQNQLEHFNVWRRAAAVWHRDRGYWY